MREFHHSTATEPSRVRLNTQHETADRLGCSLRTIDSLVAQDLLRTTRISPRRVGFTDDAIARFVAPRTA